MEYEKINLTRLEKVNKKWQENFKIRYACSDLLSYLNGFSKADRMVNKKIEEYANEFFEKSNLKYKAVYINNDQTYGGEKNYDRFLSISHCDDFKISEDIKILNMWEHQVQNEMPKYKELLYKNEFLQKEHIQNYEKLFEERYKYTKDNFEEYNNCIRKLEELNGNMLTLY